MVFTQGVCFMIAPSSNMTGHLIGHVALSNP